jgi:uncharacterized membrane protein
MPKAHTPTTYLCAALTFLGLDAVWLSTMADRLYRPAIGHLMQAQFDPWAALVFYVLYLVGLVHFAVRPGLQAASPRVAWASGALLGLVAYGTYDLTNQATLKDWPWVVTLTDLAWGAFVTGAAAWVACTVALRRTR